MLQLFYKKDGAVSVFLTIILVPILVVCCFFVDASKVQLSKGVVSSAADLTMNTVLTQYDPILNDYYGLMASSQDINEFLGVTNDYFQACFESAGFESSTARKYADALLNMVSGEGDVVDFLNITEFEEFKVEEAGNGDLQNPALVKKEIIEFMKYRAPIDAIELIIEKIRNQTDALKNAEDDAELIDKKKDYYESLSKLTEQSLKVYEKIVEYEAIQPTREQIDEMRTYIQSLKSIYQENHVDMVKNLYNTQEIEYRGEGDDIYTAVINESVSNPQATQINSCISNAASNISSFLNAASRFDNAESLLPAASNLNYGMQEWVKYDQVLGQQGTWGSFRDAAKSMIRSMKRLEVTYNLLMETEQSTSYTLRSYTGVSTSGAKTRKDHYEALKEQYENLYQRYFGNSGTYRQVWEKLSQLQQTWNHRRITTDTNTRIANIYAKLNEFYNSYDDASNKVGELAAEVDKLYDLVIECNNTFTAWNNKAHSYGSDSTDTVSGQNREEISKLDKEIMEKVTSESVTTLKNRANNVKSLLGSLKNGIDEYKYNNTKVRTISNYESFKSASGVSENRIVINTNELDAYAQSSFHFTESSSLQSVGITDNNNPNIKEVNTPSLYSWIKERFYNYKKDDPDASDAHDKYKREKEKTNKIDEEEFTSDASENELLKGAGSSPQSLKATEIFQAELKQIVSKISALMTDFSGAAVSEATELRDELYAMDYIFNMFSWDTYHKEGNYKLEHHVIPGTDWGNTDLEFTANKTLTNKMINKANNWSFGNEIEYILYGETNKKNKQKAYSNIFIMRFITDLVPMMIHYMGTQSTGADVVELDATADAVEFATYGVVPAMLFKTVVALGLTIKEAADDIKYLKEGKPVLLIKKQDQLENLYLSKGYDRNGHEEELKNGMYYSNYLQLFLFIKLVSSTGEYKIYERTADVIAANLREIHEKGFTLDKASVYFTGNGSVRVPALFMSLPIVTNNGYSSLMDGGWNTIKIKMIRGY